MANPVAPDNDHLSPFEGLPRIGNYYLLHEQDGIRYVLRKIAFIKQKRFRLKDHQYCMSALTERNAAPKLISNCENGIAIAIRIALEKLRDHYNEANLAADERERCYITILQSRLETGIQVGNFHLHVESLSRIADIAATRLSDFINSNAYIRQDDPSTHIKLDDTFQIRFQVISEPHVNSRIRRAANTIDNDTGLPGTYDPIRYSDEPVQGSKRKADKLDNDQAIPPKKLKRNCRFNWLTPTPRGYKGFPDIFADLCLIVSCTLGKLYNEAHEEGTSELVPSGKGKKALTVRGKRVRSIQVYFEFPRAEMTQRVGQIVNAEIQELYRLKPEVQKRPNFLGDCSVIADVFKSQIIIYSSDIPPKLVALYPNKPDISLPPIFLYRTRSTTKGSSTSHLELIKDIVMFYNTRGFSCIGCPYETKRFKRSRHHCKAKATRCCFVCNKILLKPDSYTNLKTIGLFCDSEIRRTYNLPNCPRCKLKFFSKKCQQSHNLDFCKEKGFTCEKKCRKFIRSVRTQQVLDAHKCTNKKPCQFCREPKLPGKFHVCPWALPKKHNELDNLAFLHITFGASETDSNELAGICPLLVAILFEDQQHCQFSRKTIFDSRLKTDVHDSEKCFEFNYFPYNLISKFDMNLNHKRTLTKFSHPKARDIAFEESLNTLRHKSDKTVLEKFICLVMCEAFRNFTFVTTDISAINCLIRSMASNNLIRNHITIRGSQATSFYVPCLSIKFICLAKFLQGSTTDFITQFDMNVKPVFVPRIPDDVLARLGQTGQQLGLPLSLDFNLPKAPSFEHYKNVTDSKQTQEAKMQYWNSIKDEPFSYVSCLENASDAALDICGYAGLQFVKVSMIFQHECLKFYDRPAHIPENSTSLLAVPPFKFISLTSFVMASFRTFAKETISIKVGDDINEVSRSADELFCSVIGQYGCRLPSSEFELEATEFLRFKQPKAWRTQWSNWNGQKKFYHVGDKYPFAVADAYNEATKTCFFFNGCYWHGHNCKTYKGNNEKLMKSRYEKFNSTIEMLLKGYPEQVKSCQVLWECQFSHLKLKRANAPGAGEQKLLTAANCLLPATTAEMKVELERQLLKLKLEPASCSAANMTDPPKKTLFELMKRKRPAEDKGQGFALAAKMTAVPPDPKRAAAIITAAASGASLPSPFMELKISNSELLKFLKAPNTRPFQSMVIRDAFRAALCETYALKYVKSDGDGSRCWILDISSLYPFIGIHFDMPCGSYLRLIGDDFEQDNFAFKYNSQDAAVTITETNGNAMAAAASKREEFKGKYPLMEFKKKPVIAIVHCRIFPPKDLLHPFLHTVIDGNNVGTLCYACAKAVLAPDWQAKDPIYKCLHSDLERSFDGSYTSSELAYAFSLGYKFHFFELIVYHEFTQILKPFLSLLGFHKLKHCQFPSHVKSEEQKADYCKDINTRMDFKNVIKQELSPEMITPNEEQRSFYKACLNYFLGSFGTNVEKYHSVAFVDCYEDLIRHVKSERLQHMEPISEDLVQATLSNKEVKPSRTSCVTISCMITSLARVVMHQKMQKLNEMNAQILRVSTDALYFVLDEKQEMPFKLSESFGHFKSVYPDVLGVVQMGVKNMSVLYKDENGAVKENFITSGISLYNDSALSYADYAVAVEKLIQEDIFDSSQFKIDQVRCQRSLRMKRMIEYHQILKVFNANLCRRRQILATSFTYQTVPFGFCGKMPIF